MPYNTLILRHLGPSLVYSANSTSQYGSPMVAATTLSKGCFVRSCGARGRLAPTGLSLPSSGTKPFGAPAGARSRKHFYGQFASPADLGRPSPLPPPGSAFEPRGGGGIAAVAGNNFLSWLRRRSKPLCTAFYRIVSTAMLAPNWLRLTTYWCLYRRRQTR